MPKNVIFVPYDEAVAASKMTPEELETAYSGIDGIVNWEPAPPKDPHLWIGQTEENGTTKYDKK